MDSKYVVPQLYRSVYMASRDKQKEANGLRTKRHTACMKSYCRGIDCNNCAFSNDNYKDWKKLSKDNRIRHVLMDDAEGSNNV